MATRQGPDRGAALVAFAVAVAAGAGVIGLVIGRATEDSETVTVTAPAQPRQAEERPAADMGGSRGAYLAAGCAACHGEKAEGTGVGPSLAGHTVAQVHQQVRSPLGQMPAYPPQQLSDEELDKVAGYIADLKSEEKHVEPVKLSEVVAVHHWMAIGAIAADDRNDAIHHVGHIIEGVQGEHLAVMKRARTLLRAGELHEAEHLIEEMLAGKAKPELGLPGLTLRLALTAVDQRNRNEAMHQLRHFLQTARGAKREKAQAILAHLREGDMHGAEHGIADLLGIARD